MLLNTIIRKKNAQKYYYTERLQIINIIDLIVYII